MLTKTEATAEFFDSKVKRLAVLWDIERTDGTLLYFTNHDVQLPYGGNNYEPAGGADASARRAVDALRDGSVEFRGGISSDLITQEELRQGRYRQAKITERVVVWASWVAANR